MKNLKRVEQPIPVEPEWKMCAACGAFRAECHVPTGESSRQMCWTCAHAVADHGCELEDAMTHECECMPQDIYPHRADEPRGRSADQFEDWLHRQISAPRRIQLGSAPVTTVAEDAARRKPS